MAYTVSEISARSPDMAPDDFNALVEDIRTNGQLVPIWLRGNDVIDGRKRLAACERLGIAPKIINLDPSQDAESVARALNVLRTHYTLGQRAMFAEARVNATKADGHKLRQGSPPICSELPTDSPIVSTRRAAKEAGIDHSAVNIARKVRRQGAPEVVKAVETGALTLHAATQIVKQVPKPEQAAAVVRVIEANKGKAVNTPVSAILSGTDPRKDRAIRYPRHQQFARAVEMMETASEIAASTVDAIATDARRRELLDSLRHIRTTLTRTINSMEAAA